MGPLRSPLSSMLSFSSAPSHLCFTRIISFSKRYQLNQIGTASPSGESRYFRLPLVLSHPCSLKLFYLPYESPCLISLYHPMSGPFVSQSLLTFLFGQTWSEIKTLQNWRAVASTHPLMLFPTFSREALLACPPSLPWNPPSLTVESTLSSALFHSDSLLFRQGAALAHLDSLPPYDLWVWTDASVPFPFGKGGSSVLANCSLCGTETTLFWQAR